MAEDVWTWVALAVTAAAALVAALLGNRYMHLLEVREAHHGDISERVLRPWRRYAEWQAGRVTWRGLVDWAILDLPNGAAFAFPSTLRSPTASQMQDSAYLPTETPLWERSREHWKQTHATWEDLQVPLQQTTILCTQALRYIEDKMKPHAGQVRWQFDRPDIPMNGLRVVVLNLWRSLVENQFADFPSEPKYEVAEVVVGSEDARLRLSGGDIAFGQRKALESAKATVEALYSDPALEAMLQETMLKADQAREGFRKFARQLEQLEYDRNLGGRCSYCPGWFPISFRP